MLFSLPEIFVISKVICFADLQTQQWTQTLVCTKKGASGDRTPPDREFAPHSWTISI